METLPTILKQTASLLYNILDVPRVLHETTNLTSQMLFIYIMTQKTLYICSELLLTLANFQNSFTVILSMKFATKQMPYFPPSLKRVTAISCKI